jgi:hypothetical protein
MTAEPTTAGVRQVPATRPRRSWRQFSLRTLLVAMLVLSVFFALFAWRLQRARRQAAAVATIRKLGGVVTYDYQVEAEKKGKTVVDSPMPAWLVRWLGQDFFHEVVKSTMNRQEPKSDDDIRAFWSAISQLSQLELFQASGKWVNGRMATEAVGKHRRLRHLMLSEGNVHGNDLEPLARLSQLEVLWLQRNPIGDDGTNHLRNFPHLEDLKLTMTEIGDDSMPAIVANSKLQRLAVDFTQVSDRGAELLARLPHLESLTIGWTKITDDGLPHLAKLRQLRFLTLGGTKISDTGLVHLAPLTNLEVLDVQQTQVTGTAFSSLQPLSQIEILTLLGCPVTDEGLPWIAKQPRLTHVDLRGTKVGSGSVAALKRDQPKATVIWP